MWEYIQFWLAKELVGFIMAVSGVLAAVAVLMFFIGLSAAIDKAKRPKGRFRK